MNKTCANKPSSLVHVAVGVLMDDQQRICIAKRPAGKHLAGLWEFPGGKVELGETVLDALKREINEELGLQIHSASALHDITFSYPEKTVLLEVLLSEDFSGEAEGREGQEVQWVHATHLRNYEFPEANKAIIDAILSRLDLQ